jgi:GNAT superfamily N-acetyltransferase
MTEIVTIAGPLEPERLRWIADLYGRADAKFRRTDVLEHLFTQSPAGGGLHAFALAEGRPVGHCSVVPMPARRGSEPLRTGKLEALFVEEPYRGQRQGRKPVVLELLSQLYSFADEHGIEVVHAFLTRRIGRITGFTPLEGVGEPSFVAIVTPEPAASTARRLGERGLAFGQRAAQAVASVGAASGGIVREATAADADLAAADLPPTGCWTSVAEDAWDWYRASPLVRVLELKECRALVQLPGKPREPVRLIGWRPERAGLRPALNLLVALGRLARREGAATLRFQPWRSPPANGDLWLACRLLAFLPRHDLTTLWVRMHDPALARPEAVLSTPLFSLGF